MDINTRYGPTTNCAYCGEYIGFQDAYSGGYSRHLDTCSAYAKRQRKQELFNEAVRKINDLSENAASDDVKLLAHALGVIVKNLNR